MTANAESTVTEFGTAGYNVGDDYTTETWTQHTSVSDTAGTSTSTLQGTATTTWGYSELTGSFSDGSSETIIGSGSETGSASLDSNSTNLTETSGYVDA